ncbi:MORN repeat protein [Ichthyophthirius multifiliis]|uniref:MORN repeat protein n=1 Tax=Ichthyophthirius multifiliis TaxID=5932 RepID=G0R2U9_ICHMU|nr:MORN repeat protein [Ichthyophthirius multifiliis]EGR28221.1 MORN repeat protein [Ichthyophthirius multifiliis]|eukprot:XP_004027566.1 MORN repeat protein [Ichthyophthirius multifiliis]
MGSCCSDQNIQNQFDNHNARVTNLYQETDAQTEEIKKQTPANVTAAQVEYIISDEKREEQENKQEINNVSNDQRIDIYQYVQFVENYKDYLDEQGLINNVKIDQFEKHIQAQLKNILKIPIQNEDGSYKLASGAIYEGKLDENYGKVGKGKLKDKDYEFEGEFQNDLPSGNGKEIRKQVVYEGSFQKGLYDGFGKLSFPNGRVYEGNFKNHQFHGKGELINDDGVRYKGDWENGCLLIGVISYHDGSYYTGSLKGNFFKDGKGTLYNKESMPQYEGLWENDQPKICKVFNIFDNHHIFYDGEMENYAITGKGERFYPDGKYQGQLQRDRKEGKGNMLYSDGAKFEGFWENDLQTKGKYIYNLKNPQFFYDGQWKNGIQEGEGEYKYPSGGIYKGDIKANKRHGFGTYLYSNGNKYVGIWDNNNQQGDGQFYFASENNEHGDVYSGQFEQGKFNGFGNYFYKKSGKQYIGYWENDKWNGIGIFRNKDGKIIKCGEWKSDKFIKDVDEKDVVFPADWENKYKIISDIGEQLQNPQDQDQQ